jgi:hypothetical protein
MNLIQRVQAILLKPKETWPEIEAEATDTVSLYKNYILILAAIPALATFIGLSLIGVSGFGFSYKVPLLTGLTQMLVSYVLSLAMVYVLALIADALAPSFGGQKHPMNALKLVAYGSTAGMLGGIFSLIPSLSMLGLLAALYSIYLIFTGLPVLMKNPPDKSLPYTAVMIVCGVVAGVVIGALSQLFSPNPGIHMGAGTSTPEITINTPKGEIHVDTEKMEDWSKRMEAAGKRMEEAQQSGDKEAMEKSMKEMMDNMGIKPPPED